MQMLRTSFTTLPLLIVLAMATRPADGAHANVAPEVVVSQSATNLTISNELVRIEYDLARGTYDLIDRRDDSIVVGGGSLQIDDLTTNGPGIKRSWKSRDVADELGAGKAVLISTDRPDQPILLFEITLYEGKGFVVLAGGIENTTDQPFQLKTIKPLMGVSLFDDVDMSRNFRLLDGNGGGEPLEWGVKEYTAVTAGNYTHSRNNILMTFGENDSRHSIVLGGLTYHEFEKYATIEQPRKLELTTGPDGRDTLVCYLNLPEDESDTAGSGESLRLVEGSSSRRFSYHALWGSEFASAAQGTEGVILAAEQLDGAATYHLGLSWWHTDQEDRVQSLVVDSGPGTKRFVLIDSQKLPTWSRKAKIDPEQVELPLPKAAYASGRMRILVESNTDKPEALVNEIWLRKGLRPMLPGKLTAVGQTTRPRYEIAGSLYAEDPVGRRVDPGVRYLPDDRFYIDFTTDNPFENLEQYARNIQRAQKIKLSMYDFPTVCLWYAHHRGYGGGAATNDTVGAVAEMDVIRKSGFLNYSRAAVRLVPDCYSKNNQQGWWDDERFQKYGSTNLGDFEGGTYKEPYETSEKWGKAIIERGGIPLTYCQTGFRSEDYAHTFPEHMLFNNATAWMHPSYERPLDDEEFWGNAWGKSFRVWSYDYTDPGFVKHLRDVYANFRKGSIKGLMFDYPARGWASGGGMEDQYATTARAYRDIFRIAQEGLGEDCYLHERNMERGSDITLGLVASQRTENDTDRISPGVVTRCGLRWYKNRVVVNYDTDSKNIYRLREDRDAVRAVMTMSYVTTGRLLLANSFTQLSPEIIRDLTRVYPFHTTPKTARPVDAFTQKYPRVYDFEVSPKWHQVTLFNTKSKEETEVGVKLAGSTAEGCLGLNPNREYYAYDFWNDRFLGKIAGSGRLVQTLRPGEARMISLHEIRRHPQFIATDRHVMQGYVDISGLRWSAGENRLSGVSQVVANDPYVVTVATNGHAPLEATTDTADTKITMEQVAGELLKLSITCDTNAPVRWYVQFEK